MIDRIALAEHPDAWRRAAERATVHSGVSVAQLTNALYFTSAGLRLTFEVVSASRPDTRYETKIAVIAGEVSTACNCPAGSHGQLCWHAATVARALGHTPPPAVAEDPDLEFAVEALKKLGKDDAPADAVPAPSDAEDRRQRIEAAGQDLGFVFNGGYRAALTSGALR